MFSWRPAGWRWLTLKRENYPYVVTGLLGTVMLGSLLAYQKGLNLPNPGFTEGYHSEVKHTKQLLLDNRRVKEIANKRKKMLQKRAEAEEYFSKHPYKPTATNFGLLRDAYASN